MNRRRFPVLVTRPVILLLALAFLQATPGSTAEPKSDVSVAHRFVENHCLDCHTGEDSERGFDLTEFATNVSDTPEEDWDTEIWERVLKRVSAGQMPPPDAQLPESSETELFVAAMRRQLARQADAHPDPGYVAPLRRLTRVEYQNSIRDLVGVSIDASTLLPADPSSDGFDNITVGELSPVLLQRYLRAAERISRLAVGRPMKKPDGRVIRLPADQTQESHVDGLPLGTRGGTLIRHHFPNAGTYEIQIRLMRDRDEAIEGLKEKHEIDILVDRSRASRLVVEPPKRGKDDTRIDANLKARFSVSAGQHAIGVTFVQKYSSLLEIKRQPFDASYNRHRHPRRTPAIGEISIVGPLSDQDSAGGSNSSSAEHVSRSRHAVFADYPIDDGQARNVARKNLERLIRLAYRRPATEDDLVVPMDFFDAAFESRDPEGPWQPAFEAGTESALASILVNPHFLFRMERGRDDAAADDSIIPLSDLELASRLSFFLWSSLPDEELIRLASKDQLHLPDVLEQQVRRMLSDERSRSLVENFADQWLYLRNLPTITPDLRRFADFDNNLRDAFRGETQAVFAAMVRDDISVLSLIRSDHTYLNDRLALHYGVPGVVGDHFRRVKLPPDSRRGGILRHGSILMATSYATRTSPTIRGNWVLENILGTPPPPPPPNVPTLQEEKRSHPTTLRERLALHRADPACASCHDLIDPVGFALENYDAVGRWRWLDSGTAIDSSGQLPDGTEIAGIEELENGILRRPEMFVATMSQKLLTYALGRTIEPTDGVAVRRIVERAEEKDYRFSELVVGIVQSKPFLLRQRLPGQSLPKQSLPKQGAE